MGAHVPVYGQTRIIVCRMHDNSMMLSWGRKDDQPPPSDFINRLYTALQNKEQRSNSFFVFYLLVDGEIVRLQPERHDSWSFSYQSDVRPLFVLNSVHIFLFWEQRYILMSYLCSLTVHISLLFSFSNLNVVKTCSNKSISDPDSDIISKFQLSVALCGSLTDRFHILLTG